MSHNQGYFLGGAGGLLPVLPVGDVLAELLSLFGGGGGGGLAGAELLLPVWLPWLLGGGGGGGLTDFVVPSFRVTVHEPFEHVGLGGGVTVLVVPSCSVTVHMPLTQIGLGGGYSLLPDVLEAANAIPAEADRNAVTAKDVMNFE